VDKADAGAWAESLRNDPMVMSPISPHDATHLLEAYAALDLELHLRDLLETHWGGIVRNNEPTVPEFWQTGEANGLRYREDFSRCHPYGSGPAYVLMQYVLGARPAAPGWAKASIRPHSMGLAFASGRVPTPLGDLGISWERGDTSWDMEIELPKGMQAELCFARLAWAGERLLVDGQIVRQTDHWTEYTDQAHRRYASAGPREMRCTISSPGRHTVRLESY
jgi:hypothetical protein